MPKITFELRNLVLENVVTARACQIAGRRSDDGPDGDDGGEDGEPEAGNRQFGFDLTLGAGIMQILVTATAAFGFRSGRSAEAAQA